MKRKFLGGKKKAKEDSIPNEAIEADNSLRQFESLVKTLIAMSMELEDQQHFYGIGTTAIEMLEDFYSYYTLRRTRLMELELVNPESSERLDEIDALTDKWSSEKEAGFWVEMEKYHQEWDTLRKLAKLTLVSMEKGNWTVAVSHEDQFDETGKVIGQKTTVDLLEK